MFIDTHCHLDFQSFAGDLPDVLTRAKQNGVYYFIDPGLDLVSSQNALSVAHHHPEIYAAVGIHPNDLNETSLNSAKSLGNLLQDPKCVAVGEIGLDYFHNRSDHEMQIRVFILQIDLALTNKLPVIIHSRESIKDVIHQLKIFYKTPNTNSPPGVIHSFEGTIEDAYQIIELGFLLGVGGPITYKNSHTKEAVVKEIPLSSIVLETDCPFLSPAPLRGTRNEPANIKIIAEKIAKIKECDIKQVEIQTTKNASALFRIGEEIDLN